jgi:mRNA interferase RelE/StbE
MGRYRISFRKSVARDLRRIPSEDVRGILSVIEALSDEPRPPGVEKLSRKEKYRVRQGSYRIIYEIRDRELLVIVVKVGHRKDVYRHR